MGKIAVMREFFSLGETLSELGEDRKFSEANDNGSEKENRYNPPNISLFSAGREAPAKN